VLRKFSKDVAIYGGADLLFRMTQFLAVPVYAHLLSVADFGIMALLTVSATLLGMLLSLGVNNAVQRFYFDPEADPADRPVLVSTGLAQLLASGLLAVGIALLILSGLREEIRLSYGIEWALLLIVLLTVLPEQIGQYCLDAVRLQFAPFKFFAIALVKNLLGVLIGLWLLIRWEMGVAGILLGTLIGAAASVPIGLVMIRRDLTFRVDPAVARKLVHFGYPFVLAGAAYWVFGSMDRWMLIELSDVVQVGLFSIGMKFAVVISFVISAFAQAWSPFAMRMYGEDPNYRLNFARIFSGWFFLLAFIGLGLSLFATEVMVLLTPREYWGAAPVLSVAAAGVAMYGTVQITVLGISLERRTILLTYGAWLAAAANVILNLLLVPRLGAMGAAVSTFAAYFLLTGSFLFWSQRLHPIPLERVKLGFSLALIGVSIGGGLVLAPLGIGLLPMAIKATILLAALGGAFLAGIVDKNLYRQILMPRGAPG
jgi:O-antigen/teichoic acid export membrane protein